MSIRAMYDPKEDRMLLVLQPGGVEQRLWVTRRQWLALYQEVAARAPKSNDDKPIPPAPRAKRLAAQEIGDAAALDGIRLKQDGDQTQFALASSSRTVVVKLGLEGMASLKRMLEVQADRAGWDPAAAMKRLKAAALAGAAVKRARS